MARKQVGQIDAALLAAIDADAERRGQTRRVWLERAARQVLDRDASNGRAIAAAEEARAACEHELRQVRPDGRAVSCGTCGAALELNAEDLRRLAAAGPEPANVPYAPATVPPAVRRDIGPKPLAATKPIPKGGKR